MANSYVSYPANGVQTLFTVTFPYLDKTHVHVYVDGVENTAFSWNSSTVISISPAPANGKLVTLKRGTPAGQQVTFTDGATLAANDLNVDTLQSLYIALEAEDAASSVVLKPDGTLDAGNRRLTNLADPVNAQDAVTKSYADSTIPSMASTATTQAGIATTQAGAATTQAGLAAASAVAAASYAASIGFTLATDNIWTGKNTFADVAFSGAGRRITGDFSNATLTSRVLFQTSTANSATVVGAIPNGSGTSAIFEAFSVPDADNASSMRLYATASASVLEARKTGTGTYQPMTFYTGGSERARFDSSGNFGVNVTPATTFHVKTSSGWHTLDSVGAASIIDFRGTLDTVQGGICIGTLGGAANTLSIKTASTERLRVDASGNVLTVSPAGLGYGVGAGGTVTQATSKATTVTLNKPTGTITMNNASLAAGAVAGFQINNSLITVNDTVVVTIKDYLANYNAWPGSLFAGGFYIALKNISAGALAEPVSVNFSIIKGASA